MDSFRNGDHITMVVPEEPRNGWSFITSYSKQSLQAYYTEVYNAIFQNDSISRKRCGVLCKINFLTKGIVSNSNIASFQIDNEFIIPDIKGEFTADDYLPIRIPPDEFSIFRKRIDNSTVIAIRKMNGIHEPAVYTTSNLSIPLYYTLELYFCTYVDIGGKMVPCPIKKTPFYTEIEYVAPVASVSLASKIAQEMR